VGISSSGIGFDSEIETSEKKALFLRTVSDHRRRADLYFFSTPVISDRLLYSLESQYPSPDVTDLSNLDIIVVMGGGYYPSGVLYDSQVINVDNKTKKS